MSNTNTAGRVTVASMPFAMIAFVGLLIAKMAFAVNIPWIWVLAPFWVPLAVYLGVLSFIAVIGGAFVAIAFLGALIAELFRKASRKVNA